ncbi:aldo/keto reductase [Curtobacterium albidum]|uniref:Aldo/keto reductase n=1 Tax=Curtobacterium citreum TaxID=2036 RepID=A0A850DWE8_9MICO|nr:aldo/keto reductase [Curtobacterium albidum]
MTDGRTPPLQQRSLHRGLPLTTVGFGGAQIGNLYQPISDDDARAAVEKAWASGIRFFDSAPHYGLGLSERRLGAALQERPRDEYVLSTKVGRLLEPTPERAHLQDDDGFAVPAATRRVFDFSRDGILRSLEASLDRLGTDRIDIAFLHDPDEHWEQASTSGIDTLVELRDQGVLRAVGAGMNQTGMLTRFVEQCDVDVVMVAGRYSLLDQGAERDLLPAAREHDVDVIVAGVYNSGILSRPIVPETAFYDYRAADEELIARARSIARVCALHGVDLPTAAVQFPLRRAEVRSVVLGTGTVRHVEEGILRGGTEVPEELWEELTSLGLVTAGR